MANTPPTAPAPQEIGLMITLVMKDFKHRLHAKSDEIEHRGIRANHGPVVTLLAAQGEARMVDLANGCGMRPQSMMTIINELQSQGYVERIADPEDSRAKLIRFTPNGKALMAYLTEVTLEIWQEYVDIVGQKELEQCMQVLNKLVSVRADN